MRKRKKNKNSLLKWFVSFFAILVLLALGANLSLSKRYPDNFCANSISCIKDLSGKFEEEQTVGVFLGNSIPIPKILAQIKEQSAVLGESTTKDKKIYIDLSTQRLFATEDNKTVYDFPISSGKWAETPTGTFNIWAKLRYTRMSGGDPSIGTYYNLPNVPYVMYFHNGSIPKTRGFAIHGAYWHNNFGHPMSHGCVNMRIEDAGKLYAWANPQASENTTYTSADNPGTEIVIYGETPNE